MVIEFACMSNKGGRPRGSYGRSPRFLKLVELVTEGKMSLNAAVDKAGYSPKSGGSIIRTLKNHPLFKEKYKPDVVKLDIVEAEEDFKKGANRGDNFCRIKALELRAKIAGVLQDKNTMNVAVFGNIESAKKELMKEIPLPEIDQVKGDK